MATGPFVVPPSTGGTHRVTGTDDSGHTTYTRFETLPSLVAQSPVAVGAVRVMSPCGASSPARPSSCAGVHRPVPS